MLSIYYRFDIICIAFLLLENRHEKILLLLWLSGYQFRYFQLPCERQPEWTISNQQSTNRRLATGTKRVCFDSQLLRSLLAETETIAVFDRFF